MPKGGFTPNLESGVFTAIAVTRLNWKHCDTKRAKIIETTLSNNSIQVLCSLIWPYILSIWLQSMKRQFQCDYITIILGENSALQ